MLRHTSECIDQAAPRCQIFQWQRFRYSAINSRDIAKGLRNDTAHTYGHLDATILRYINSALSVTLNIILVVALLGFFGVETTTFAALLAGVGIAIGATWSGLLANFAAGIFLVLLRPFKVGDFVT